MAIESFFAAIEQAGIAAAAEALTRSAGLVAGKAKDLAPVRKVFTGQDRHYETRLKTISEIENDRDIRKRLNLGPEHTHFLPPSVVTKRAPQLLHLRGVTRVRGQSVMRRTEAQTRLDRHGRYELKSGRAIHKGELGGRLRDEIQPTEAEIEGHHIVARVVSPTPYAKYQEFGTRHNPAHPYLRPALHDSVGEIKTDVGQSVAAAGQQAVGSVEISVTWTMKARS